MMEKEKKVSSARFERATCCLGGNRSIHLSYENTAKDSHNYILHEGFSQFLNGEGISWAHKQISA